MKKVTRFLSITVVVSAILAISGPPAQAKKFVIDPATINNFIDTLPTISVQDLREHLLKRVASLRNEDDTEKARLGACGPAPGPVVATNTSPPDRAQPPAGNDLASKTQNELMAMMSKGDMGAAGELRRRAVAGFGASDAPAAAPAKAPTLPSWLSRAARRLGMPGDEPVAPAGSPAPAVGPQGGNQIGLQKGGSSDPAAYSACLEAAQKTNAPTGDPLPIVDAAEADGAARIFGTTLPSTRKPIEAVVVTAAMPFEFVNVVDANGPYRSKVVPLDSLRAEAAAYRPGVSSSYAKPGLSALGRVMYQAPTYAPIGAEGFEFKSAHFDTSYGTADITGNIAGNVANDPHFSPGAAAAFETAKKDFDTWGTLERAQSWVVRFGQDRTGPMSAGLSKLRNDPQLSQQDRAQALGALVLYMRAAIAPAKPPPELSSATTPQPLKAPGANQKPVADIDAEPLTRLAQLFPEIKHIAYRWNQPTDPAARKWVRETSQGLDAGRSVTGDLGAFLKSSVQSGAPNVISASNGLHHLWDEAYGPDRLARIDAALAVEAPLVAGKR